MPVDTKHGDYDANKPMWDKCRTAVEGEDAVKDAGTAYLPQLEGQDAIEYCAYRQRALFYEASGRTVEGLSGAIMRKPPKIEWPESKKEQLKDVGAKMESIEQIAQICSDEVLTTGRMGVLVDADDAGVPYIALYYAEDIINWRVEQVKGRTRPTRVVLWEPEDRPKSGDSFATECVELIRVLELVDGVYTVQMWRKEEQKNPTTGEMETVWVKEGPLLVPTKRGGGTWDEIPFTFISPCGTAADVEKSPIAGLVNVNLSHYRNSADLEHGLHFTALPTAWVAGFNLKDTNSLKIGSTTAWVSKEPGATAGFLEFSGAGLGAIKETMKDKERQMATLGARILEEQQRDAEATETVRLRHSGEQSALSKISAAVSEALSRALGWVALWQAFSDTKASIELNKDFNVVGLSPQMLTALMEAVQMRGMSWDTWFYNLNRGELMPDGRTSEEELALIEATARDDMPPQPKESKNEGEGGSGSGSGEGSAAGGE